MLTKCQNVEYKALVNSNFRCTTSGTGNTQKKFSENHFRISRAENISKNIDLHSSTLCGKHF